MARLLPRLITKENNLTVTRTVLVCLTTITSDLVKINHQFTERDVTIIRLYTPFSPAADA